MIDELLEADEEGRAVLRLHVQPGAGRSEVVGRHGDALKVRVAASPEGGRANEACARLLADIFGVKPAAVTLVAGDSSRKKRFTVAGVHADALREQLERVLAPSGSEVGSGRPPSRPR
ncbi:MAG TPA: DUF167 domain-containing protein [Acidimicrobiales bacterium]|nr:DUF167 domain-containing protein [Acidimicrobiales bacterium]